MPTVSKFILQIFLSAVLLGCDYSDGDAEVPAAIAAFVAGQDLPDPQPVHVVDLAAGDGEDIDLFTVSYGPPMDCPKRVLLRDGSRSPARRRGGMAGAGPPGTASVRRIRLRGG